MPDQLLQWITLNTWLRPANTESTHRSHIAIPAVPVYANRVILEESHVKIQFSPEEVDRFLDSLPRLKNGSLGKEENCSICLFGYGEVRGKLAAPVEVSGKGKKRMSVSDDVVEEGLPGEELPELAAKLPCGHIYGELCIKTWLLERPATCPTCRYCFQPV